ncbi:type IV pilus biogenesis protein PilP [Aliiruegeria haliotis]|uniref:Type IV pilus biogenesis protein PilP n=1 Tax=Aliiruegeria haliotis TaxID=1280846 RepID=A0A2T0RV12_9RHOB|nr:hypothetical protein [Aliiruegeria haliotis]PRY24978.1 type IV pilus biogenesis protein PilP [Aliiruegeria haliotis]
MIPTFSLILDEDGIALEHRSSAGWERLGSVSIDTPDLTGALAALRAQAIALAGDTPLRSRLVIPNSQILYTSTPASGLGDDADEARILSELDGATPYDVEEITFDWHADGELLRVAAVARETLQEAEDFAAGHGFAPVCFVSIPEDDGFAGEAYFGKTQQAAILSSPDTLNAAEAAATFDDVAEPVAIEEPAPQVDWQDQAETAPDPEPGTGADVGAPPADPAIGQPQATAAAPDPVDVPVATAADAPTDHSASEPAAEADTDPADLAAAIGPAIAKPKPEADLIAESEDPDIASSDRAATKGAPAEPDNEPRPSATDAGPAADAPAAPPATEPPEEVKPLEPLIAFSSIRGNYDTAGAATSEDKSPTSTAEPTPPARTPQTVKDTAADTQKGKTKAGRKAKASAKGKGRKTPKVTAAARSSTALPTEPALTSQAPSTPSPAAPKVAVAVRGAVQSGMSEAEVLTVFGARKSAAGRRSGRAIGLAVAASIAAVVGLAALWAVAFAPSVDITLAPNAETESALLSPEAVVPLQDERPSPADALITPAPQVPEGEESALSLPGTEGAAPRTGAEGAAPGLTTDPEPDSPQSVAEPVPPVVPTTLDPDAARAAYAVTGIWQRAPERGFLPEDDQLDDLYVASIDPEVIPQDPVALPQTSSDSDIDPTLPRSPNATQTAPNEGDTVSLRDAPTAPGLSDTPATLDGTEPLAESSATGAEGVIVRKGRPFVVPPRRPETLDTSTATLVPEAENPLAEFNPRRRPGDLVETNEKATLGGRTRAQLARIRPAPRPASTQETTIALAEAARMADAETERGQEAIAAEDPLTPEQKALAVDLATATRRAVPVSPMPRLKPANISQIANRARLQQTIVEQQAAEAAALAAQQQRLTDQQAAEQRKLAAAKAAEQQKLAVARAAQEAERNKQAAIAAAKQKQAAEKAAAASAARSSGPAVSRAQRAKPTAPSSKAVARRATVKNALALNKVSLIGVYGTSSKRRALVRLPSGRYVKVKVGDRLDGGRVAAIGQGDLRYKKGSRTVTIKMPKG